MTNVEKLAELMAEYNLSRQDVADMLLCHKDTVNKWFRDPKLAASRNMPAAKLRMLKMTLENKEYKRPRKKGARVVLK